MDGTTRVDLSPRVKEAADGRRIVHYDGQAFELTPSPGEVVCPGGSGTAIHHRKDCGHIAGTEDTWKVYPDPDRDIWARLLESAPASDTEGRQRFAKDAGLRNGLDRPVTQVCQSCALTRLTTVGGVPVPAKPLSQALQEFDRGAHTAQVAEADAEVAQVVSDFPIDVWPDMRLDQYALGTDVSKRSFCYRMEFGTLGLCSMKGGHAGKHIIYRRKKEQSWKYPTKYDDELGAWEDVRSGFVQAFETVRAGRLAEIDAIDALRPGPALTAKAVSCYFPSEILPIASRDHVRAFILHLSGDSTQLEAFAAHERLKELIDADKRFAEWHPYEVMFFLYEWADPRPSTSTILKVAPGESAKYWDECLKGGYICIGWDAVGDLTEFGSEEEFRAAFEESYSAEYQGNKSKISAKANELWRLYQLEPGDRVVANKGIKEVLAVGTVTRDGYKWLSERQVFQHTVAVEWDTNYAQVLQEPQKSWGTVTVAKVANELWKSLQEGAVTPPPDKVVPADPMFAKLAKLLQRKGQAVLYGPPGTGKTYTSLRFALWWLADQLPEAKLDPLADYGSADFQRSLNALHEAGHLTQVTFHPAYGYEDFIEGFRPAEADDGALRLVLRDGIFKKVCEAATANPKRPYLLLIDEINRGDIPKILGELITLLEPDKRGMHITLPTGRRFAVPSNVYILGTMNTADRSIRLLDSALRRRFAFCELLPETADVLDGQKIGDVDLGLLLRELNSRVVKELGRERQIGHSFFLPGGRVVDSEAELAAVIRTEILPLLQEYAYDDYTLLARFLGEKVVDVHEHTVAGLSDDQLVEALAAELQAATSDQ